MFLDVGSVCHYSSTLYRAGKSTWFWQPAIRGYNLLLVSGSGDLHGKKNNIVFIMFCSVE